MVNYQRHYGYTKQLWLILRWVNKGAASEYIIHPISWSTAVCCMRDVPFTVGNQTKPTSSEIMRAKSEAEREQTKNTEKDRER